MTIMLSGQSGQGFQTLLAILVAIGVGAAVLSYIVSVSLDKFRGVKYLTKLLGEQYGFCREKYLVHYEIQENLSAKIAYTERFRVINAELAGVEHHNSIPSEPAEARQQFSVQVEADPNRGEVEVVPKLILATPSKLYYQLLFTPPLKVGATIEYTYEVKSPEGMFLDSEEGLHRRNLPFDYVSSKVSYPTEVLDLTLVFPNYLRAERVEYDVWMGDARLRLKKEYRRLDVQGALEIGRKDGCLFARLRVDHPILGLRYAIRWMPTRRDPN